MIIVKLEIGKCVVTKSFTDMTSAISAVDLLIGYKNIVFQEPEFGGELNITYFTKDPNDILMRINQQEF